MLLLGRLLHSLDLQFFTFPAAGLVALTRLDSLLSIVARVMNGTLLVLALCFAFGAQSLFVSVLLVSHRGLSRELSGGETLLLLEAEQPPEEATTCWLPSGDDPLITADDDWLLLGWLDNEAG